MFTKLTDTNKAAIFSVLVLCLSVGAALLIRFLDLSPGLVMWTLWSITPTVATLIMLLVVTRDGYSKEGWKSLGLHRLGLNVWWIAFGATLLITVAASAVVWATPLASFAVPEGGIINAYHQLPHLLRHDRAVVRPRRRDRDARLLAAPPHVLG